jgi:FKBP-type peptidyl-prolyl cis-trans isomerase FkpA
MTIMKTEGLVLAAIGVLVLFQGCNGAGAGAGAGAAAEPGTAAKAVELKTEEDRTLYALGVTMGGSLSTLSLSAEEVALVSNGLSDAATGADPKVDMAAYGPKIRQFAQERTARSAQAEKDRSQAFLDQAAAEQGATRSDTGMVYVELVKGVGESPTPQDKVKVHYRGTLTDGTQFDSSYDRGEPAEFPLNAVIPCWTEGLQKMAVGGKAKFICPSSVAYGDSGRPPVIPGGATLVFEVELIDIPKG